MLAACPPLCPTPPLPSTHTQRSRQYLRERCRFRNDGWTKWEAVQLTDELKATRLMVKADWECWKKLEERFKRIHGPLLSDSDEDDQDKARRDKRIRQKWNVGLLQHAQEMGLRHQELCSKKTKKDKEQKAGTFIIHKLCRGKW
jgi:hypothetical protein